MLRLLILLSIIYCALSASPTRKPTAQPTMEPTTPTSTPTSLPSSRPTSQPSSDPSCQPTSQPSSQPSSRPSPNPTPYPTFRPTYLPTATPTATPTIDYNHSVSYESIDPSTFKMYTNLWLQSHKSWVNIRPQNIPCTNIPAEDIYFTSVFPVCVDGFVLGGIANNAKAHCPVVQCIPHVSKFISPPDMIPVLDESEVSCVPTPQDTMDYIPPPEISEDKSDICKPVANHFFRDSSVLPPYYGLDQGVPPLYTPIVPSKLILSGRVTSSIGTKCELVEGAIIEAWQIDATRLKEYTFDTEFETNVFEDEYEGSQQQSISDKKFPEIATTTKPKSLRDISCRGKLQTEADGKYEFSTTVPPSYGPPRHIMLSVTAPGYEKLVTRVYFDSDWRLQQLTTLNGEEQTNHISYDVASFATNRGFTNDDVGTTMDQDLFPGSIANDPRVASLRYIDESMDRSDKIFGAEMGHFLSTFHIVLKAISPFDSSKESPSSPLGLDLNGYWTEANGGIIKVETIGFTFTATEYPHSRTWGTVTGYLTHDQIRGVSFRKSKLATKDENIFDIGNDHLTQGTNIWSTAYSTGAVMAADDYATERHDKSSSLEMRIKWTGDGGVSETDGINGETEWMKVIDPLLHGYRYLKLLITKDTGGYYGGKMEINEIEFYEGILAQTPVPSSYMKMSTPRFPAPQMVTCSSYQEQDKHCWKAFDGFSNSSSSWMTKPVGHSNGDLLGSPQWILLDLGLGRYAYPTSLKIVCGASTIENPPGCPKKFQLLGSHDNKRYDLLMKKDLFDYTNEYANGGKVFNFFWESPIGRPNGHSCGSCDAGPNFACSIMAYDGTCSTRFCNINGECDEHPTCPPGEYMDLTYDRIAIPSMSCKLCAPGRYGNVSGLYGQGSSFCSGLCDAGYYCPEGSISARQNECGHSGVYCPQGSAAPIPVSAGRKTVNDGNTDSTRKSDELCDPGHYCVKGIQIQCPIGRYGDSSGLQSDLCTNDCLSGEYCPLGSINPKICEKGYYCPDGGVRVPCPAGKYGMITGLKDSHCSGLCKKGYYCNQAAVSSTSEICPAGRYGSTMGLQDSSCSGLCHAGFYCPPGSTNSEMHECGSSAFYCPIGSPLPVPVSEGYYTLGGIESQRSSQAPCEKGFYCTKGIKISCPAGTYGDSMAMSDTYKTPTHPLNLPKSKYNTSYFNTTEDLIVNDKFFCSGFCDPGYYCLENSTSPRQFECPPGVFGATEGLENAWCTNLCPMGHYCPAATVTPFICRSGIYGNRTGLISSECADACWEGGCNPNLCQEGYFCPPGSIVPVQNECGDSSVYCPTGSSLPTDVTPGYYTIGPNLYGRDITVTDNPRTRTGQKICELGYYCERGVKIRCPPGTYGNSFGLSNSSCSGLCSPGYYCPIQSYNATLYRCPAGRYGNKEGLYNSACSGSCSPGYYCPEGSTSPYEIECGVAVTNMSALGLDPIDSPSGYLSVMDDKNTISLDSPVRSQRGHDKIFMLKLPNSVFCPLGSSKPIIALPGYYTIGNNKTTRYDQLPCPVGTYCVDGIIYDCPAGTYGRSEKLKTKECTGLCYKGYYCPAGSTSRTQIPCPLGRYGDRDGLENSLCSGPCPYPLDCPEGSIRSTPLAFYRASDTW